MQGMSALPSSSKKRARWWFDCSRTTQPISCTERSGCLRDSASLTAVGHGASGCRGGRVAPVELDAARQVAVRR